MAQVRTLDGNILSWVKNEIDITMNQARQALEAHVETPDDQTQLQFCLNYLHQVSGTLQMVELYGASMLAEELERLTQSIIDNHVTKREDAYEVLMRGMMQLPDYLEKLQAGQPDYPIILLPLLNDSRAVRQAGLLSESALFSPNLEVDAPIPMERAEHPIDTLARKLRHAYHLGLLDWFRGNEVKSGLKKIATVIEKLRYSANDPDASRMLWAASGVVEALQDKGIDSSAAVKMLLGQVDRHVKKIIDQGEFALSNEPPRDLLKNLLYYVASSNSAGSLVKEIKDAFHLANVMPDKETLNRARADLAAPNAALMQTVSSVLIDDLTQIKDSLDVFMRSTGRDVAGLAGMSDKLAQMADTLGMLGFGDQRHILQDQIKVLRGMVDGTHEISEPALMDMAGALLGIEAILHDPKTKVVRPEQKASSDDSLARSFIEPEQRKLIKRVVDEAKVDLSVIKDAFNEYGRTPKQIQLLKDVPGLLDRIRGSLAMLSLDRAANILKSAAGYVQTKILNTNIRPDIRVLELLADSISSVEYYLESLVESWGHPTSILEVAEQSLLDLGISKADNAGAFQAPAAEDNQVDSVGNTLVDLPMPDGAAGQDATLQMTAPEIDMDAIEQHDDATLINIEGFDDLGQLNRADEITEPDVEGSISQEFNLPFNDKPAAKPSSPPPAPAVAPPTVTAAQRSSIADELDDEIVEIFLEEADEEHANISRLLPAWFNNPENETSLKDLRRSFHTLKGSGRLVGAIDVGEFAWAFENMLNRVIDRTITFSPEMYALMDEARNKLPELLHLFRTGGKPGQDIFNLMAQAEAFSLGKPVKTAALLRDQAPPHAVTAIPKEAIAPAPPADETESIEPELVGLHERDANESPSTGQAADIEPDLVGLHLQDDNEPTLTQQVGLDGKIQLDLSDDATENEIRLVAAGSDEITALPVEDLELVAVAEPESPLELADMAIDEAMFEATEIISLPVPSIDPTLLDIYRKEIDAHLASLNEYIAQWNAGKDRTANSKLIRAVHTIKGSSRTANVPDIADLCGVLEDHLRIMEDYGTEVDEDLIRLLQESRQFIDRTVKILDIPGAILPDNTALLAKARALGTQPLVLKPDASGMAAQPITVPAPPGGQSEEGADPDRAPDYDTELLEIFLEEGVDILNDSDQTLHAWSAEPDNSEHVKALQRQLHTLKGGARMAGVTEIGDLSHSIENLLTAIAEHDLPVNSQMLRVLQKAQDRLVGMLDIVRNNRAPRHATQLITIINELAAGQVVDEALLDSGTPATPGNTDAEVIEIDIPLSGMTTENNVRDIPAMDDSLEITLLESQELVAANDNVVAFAADVGEALPVSAEAPSEFAVVTPGEQSLAQRVRAEQVRVRADLLDNLVNFAGEVSIYRSRMDQQNNTFRYNIKELDDTVTRLRDQLRKFEIETETQIQFRYEETGAINAEFDPLEMDRFTQMQTLSRGMLESLNDLDSLRGILNNLTRESETLLLQQSRVNTELQEGLMRTRMVPISSQVPRLRRIVRQAADEMTKHAELHIDGADNELDRTVLERVMSPLEHMLRNAIAHGIERPEVRAAAGKPRNGNIRMSFARESSDIVITVTDDGAGINLDAIRNKAIERGMIKPGAIVSNESLIDLILESGFSTAEEVTQLAGRGVGMDVVNNEIKQLGGHLEIKTEAGKGATFRISMPVSLSVARALLVHVSENTYAIPLIGVETVERVTRDDILRMQADKHASYRWLENDYQYIHLSSTLGLTELLAPLEEQRTIPLLLVRSGEFRAAVHVDSLIGSREIVVKPVGPQLSTLRGISGATIMGDGSVVLILDLGVLMRITAVEHLPLAEELAEAVVVEAPEKRIPMVMVVDDSITVRKVTTRFLERNNFRTISAKDGVDALTQLQEQRPDIMLLDVEMPRMDGFELATNIRNDATLMHIPIIMITSRTGQKHRDRALAIGVNIYMGKPYSEAELLDNINKLLAT